MHEKVFFKRKINKIKNQLAYWYKKQKIKYIKKFEKYYELTNSCDHSINKRSQLLNTTDIVLIITKNKIKDINLA